MSASVCLLLVVMEIEGAGGNRLESFAGTALDSPQRVQNRK